MQHLQEKSWGLSFKWLQSKFQAQQKLLQKLGIQSYIFRHFCSFLKVL